MTIGNDKEVRRGKNYCLRLLSLRPRSEREIEFKLKGKGYSGRARKHILDLLKKDGYIDDSRFTREWIDSRIRSNPRSKKVLKIELANKGVPEEVIERAFSEKADELDEKRIAGSLVRKRLLKTGSKPDKNLKGRLFQFLLRKGFSMEITEEVVNEELGS